MAFLAAAAPYLMAAGTAMSAYSALQQGQSEYQASLMQSQIEERNAKANEIAATQSQEEASREAKQLDLQRRKLIGEQAAAAGKSGLTISGSVDDVMNDTAIQMETEIQMAKYRGQVEAYNYGQKALNNYTQAKMDIYSGIEAKRSATWSAAGTLISGAARYGSIKYGKQ